MNDGAGDEAPVGVVGVQLELERALEAVRLDEAADAQLRCVGGVRGDLPASATSVVRDVDAHAAAVGERRDEGAQRLRGAAAAPDHATAVVGVHAHLEDVAARRRR